MPCGMIATERGMGDGNDSAGNSFHMPRAFGSGDDSPHEDATTRRAGAASSSSSSDSFAGVMRALLKSSPSPSPSPSPAEKVVWQPRTALDLSGHSFSKALKAEISRSKQQSREARAAKKCSEMQRTTTNTTTTTTTTSTSVSSRAYTKPSWWAKNGGRDLGDAALSRVSPTSTLPPSPMWLHLDGAPLGSESGCRDESGADGVIDLQQRHNRQYPGSVCGSRSHDEGLNGSLAVGVGFQ
ncbi:unnamed protein product [Pylaiella littoralis]